jgi:hypothetical protein
MHESSDQSDILALLDIGLVMLFAILATLLYHGATDYANGL